MIVRWPGEIQHPGGTIVKQSATITDFYPTLMELAEATYPERFQERKLRSLTGSSLVPLLKKSGQRASKPSFQAYHFSRAWIQDEWKVVSLYDGPWQLFDLRVDRTERNDLSKKHPKRLKMLTGRWVKEARRAGIANAARPLMEKQRGWGWHRLKMVCPDLRTLSPDNATTHPSSPRQVTMSFSKPISFAGTDGKSIRLYSVSDESKPIWQASPDPDHPGQGTKELVLDGLPPLEPDQAYFFLWDAGWIKVGGKSVGRLNDGAFAWRFRTPAIRMKPD
jgi:arylsulfatase